MTRMLIAAVGCAGLLTAPAASGQERVPHPEGARERVRVEVAQAPLLAKMRVPLESKVVTGAPYSAEVITESTQVLADGNRIAHRTTGRVYRDGQGRVRREEDREPGSVGSVSITDPVGKISYSLEPEAKVAWKTEGETGGVSTFVYTAPRTESPDPVELERRRVIEHKIVTAHEGESVMVRSGVPLRHASSAWDEKVEQLPAREIEGVMADGTRTTRTIPAGAIGNERPIVIVSEEWRSRELQVLLMTSTSDPRTGESTYRLANISRQEPPASLFELPAGYTVKETGVRKQLRIPREEPR